MSEIHEKTMRLILTDDTKATVAPLENQYGGRAIQYIESMAQIVSRKAEDDMTARLLALSIAAENVRKAIK